MTNTAENPRSLSSLVERARERSRTLLYVGTGLVFAAFLLPWWGLTKYRVYEQRGVDLANPAARQAIEKDMTPEEKQAYSEQISLYEGRWSANRGLNIGFYQWALGNDYDAVLRAKENVSLTSGSLSLYGWSTKTAWFGLLAIVAGVGLLVAAGMLPQLSNWGWLVPWVWALSAFIYVAAAISFYFSVPDRNDYGYAQGVSLGNYLAVVGGLAALAGGILEGMRAAQQRLVDLENAPAEPAETESEDEPDPEAERRHRLNDW